MALKRINKVRLLLLVSVAMLAPRALISNMWRTGID